MLVVHRPEFWVSGRYDLTDDVAEQRADSVRHCHR
jgi:hypothetical protein